MSINVNRIPTDDLLIKYFFIAGLDSNNIIDTQNFLNIKNISDNHKLTPNILTLFPSFEKNNIYIDKNILLRHCFPNGFYLKNCNQFPLPEHFSFELSNYPLRGKAKKLYFTCLSFYESIENYKIFNIIQKRGINYLDIKIYNIRFYTH